MPQKIERNHRVFGPRELKRLALAFDRAWRQLHSEGIEGETFEEIDLSRTKLAQSIIACATVREHDVERLKEDGLMGFRWMKEFSSDERH